MNTISRIFLRCLVVIGLLFALSCDRIEFEGVEPAMAELESATLTPEVDGADTYVRSSSPDAANGTRFFASASTLDTALVRLSGDSIRSALVGRVILSARLEFRTLDFCVENPDDFSIHRMRREWSETQATFACAHETAPGDGVVNCVAGQAWSLAGGSAYDAVPLSTTECRNEYAVFDVTRDIEEFIQSGAASHQGWAIVGNESGDAALRFYTRTGTPWSLVLVTRSASEVYAPVEPVAPALDMTRPTHAFDAMRWLLEPERALQWGGATGIDPERAAILRGRVFDRDTGAPLAGVEVSVSGRPEVGRTATRVAAGSGTPTGNWELLVNGGGPLVLEFRRTGYLSAQRVVHPAWNDWTLVPDVALVPRSNLGCGDIGAAGGFVHGPTTTDALGANRALSIFVPAGTTVTYDTTSGAGTDSAFRLCMAEYTRQPGGGVDPLAAMPAELPPTTSFTFAAEGEVRASGDSAGAFVRSRPRFSQPIMFYVRADGFLPVPEGETVPLGTYDERRGGWSAEENGIAFRVSGAATNCVTTGTTPNPLSAPEIAAICADSARFPDNTLFLRVPVRHFSIIDLNWLIGLLTGLPGFGDESGDRAPGCRSPVGGSIIHCESQTLGEALPIHGTAHSLVYMSDRQAGRREAYRARVTPITGDPGTPSPTRTLVELVVANRRLPASGPLSLTGAAMSSPQEIVWDGNDAAGRRMVGPQRAYVRIGYQYRLSYRDVASGTASFGTSTSAELISGGGGARDVVVWVTRPIVLGTVDDMTTGLGGWGIDARHVYDPATGTLFLGNGQRRTAESTSGVMRDVVGSPVIDAIRAVAVGPDGTVYFWDLGGRPEGPDRPAEPDSLIRRLPRGSSPDDDVALGTAQYNDVRSIAVGRYWDPVARRASDVLYVADRGGRFPGPAGGNCVHRVDLATGTRTTILGTCGDAGAGMTPVSAGSPVRLGTGVFLLNRPAGLAIDSDGSVLIADTGNRRIIRYREDDFTRQVEWVADVETSALTVASDGALYFAAKLDAGRQAIERLNLARVGGIRETIAGGGATTGSDHSDGATARCTSPTDTACANVGDVTGIALDRDGNVCYAEVEKDFVDPRVRCVRDGVVTTIAGLRWVDTQIGHPSFDDADQAFPHGTEGRPATRTRIGIMGPIAFGPNGRLYFVDLLGGAEIGNSSVRMVEPPLPDGVINGHTIADSGGSVYYEFDGAGRHLRTVDAMSGAEILSFNYDEGSGRLRYVQTAEGRIEIAYSATQVTFTAPGAVVTRLNLDTTSGRATSYVDPASTTFSFTYAAGGLLERMVDGRGGIHTFTYDPTTGRLLTDTDASDIVGGIGPTQTLTLPVVAADGARSVTLTAPDDPQISLAARQTTFSVRADAAGLVRRVERGAAFVETTVPADGRSQETVTSDGLRVVVHTAPDDRPLIGADAPYASRITVTRPDGETATVTHDQDWDETATTATLIDSIGLPLGPGASGTGTFRRTVVRASDGSSTTTLVPASGSADRTIRLFADARGRLIRVEAPGQLPVCIGYVGMTNRAAWIRQSAASGGSCATTGTTATLRQTTFSYDSSGAPWLRQVVAGATGAETTSITPDARGWTDTVTLPGRSSVLDLGLDAHGLATSVRPPARSTHSFTYTGRGLPATYTPPATSAHAGALVSGSQYRADGRLTGRDLRGGRRISSTVDFATGASSGISVTGTPGTFFTVTPDDVGRPESMAGPGGDLGIERSGPMVTALRWSSTAGAGVDGRIGYDVHASGLLASERACFGSAATCGATSGGQQLTYLYDQDRVMTSAGLASGVPRMTYTSSVMTSPRLATTTVATASGLATTIEVSSLGELASTAATLSGTTQFASQICERDALGRILRREETIRAAATGTATTRRQYQYTYDARGFLTRYRVWAPTTGAVCPSIFSGTPIVDSGTLSYDDAGNWTALATNAADQPTAEGRMYDALGNLSARDQSGVQRTFAYDAFGRLRSTTRAGVTVTYDYDPLGRLVAIRPTAGTTATPQQRFIYRDGLEPIAWQRTTTSTACVGGMDTAYFVYGTAAHVPDLMYLDECNNGSIDGTYRLLSDERGSVRLVVRLSDGWVAQRTTYDMFGLPTFDLGSSTSASINFQPFGFAGGIWDREARHYRFGARDYDPSISRWTTPDPIGFEGGLNHYAYCDNDPVNAIDPSGLLLRELLAAGTTIVIAGGTAGAMNAGWQGGLTGRVNESAVYIAVGVAVVGALATHGAPFLLGAALTAGESAAFGAVLGAVLGVVQTLLTGWYTGQGCSLGDVAVSAGLSAVGGGVGGYLDVPPVGGPVTGIPFATGTALSRIPRDIANAHNSAGTFWPGVARSMGSGSAGNYVSQASAPPDSLPRTPWVIAPRALP